jgi:AraC-like DNA-binding protein
MQGARVVYAEPGTPRSASSLRDLRRDLSAVAQERPELLGARFDRYLESVALQCGYRVDAARGYLEAGFERLAETLVSTGRLDEKSFRASCDVLDRAASGARTLQELTAAYRRALGDVSEAVQRPLPAHHDRSLRGAVDYIHQHYTEPLGVARVAKAAGFAPNYFSKLFKAREKMAFAAYVSGLRVERARQLLTGTKLDATRIAELCGFRSSQYFSRVFRRATGLTPLGYREHPGDAMRKKKPKTN